MVIYSGQDPDPVLDVRIGSKMSGSDRIRIQNTVMNNAKFLKRCILNQCSETRATSF
jgi:hypothetical protein